MDVEKGLVEGMPDRRPCLDCDEEKGRGSDGTPGVRRSASQDIHGVLHLILSHAIHGVDKPGKGMKQGLNDGDSGSPSVQEVEGIVADLQKRNEWIVTESEDNGWDKIDDCENASSATQLGNDGCLILA